VYQTIDLVAVLVTVLLTGSELAIGVFVHPVLSSLQDAAHAEAAKPLARLLGKVMPFWYAAALLIAVVSLLTRTVGTLSWWACFTSAALLAATVPFSLICLVPINNRVAAWDLKALPADWKSDRKRWDQYHAIRIMILVLASIAIALATIFSQSGIAELGKRPFGDALTNCASPISASQGRPSGLALLPRPEISNNVPAGPAARGLLYAHPIAATSFASNFGLRPAPFIPSSWHSKKGRVSRRAPA